MAAASSRLETAPKEDGAGRVFLKPHLPLKGTRGVTAKVANHLDKVTTVPLELVPEQKVP